MKYERKTRAGTVAQWQVTYEALGAIPGTARNSVCAIDLQLS